MKGQEEIQKVLTKKRNLAEQQLAELGNMENMLEDAFTWFTANRMMYDGDQDERYMKQLEGNLDAFSTTDEKVRVLKEKYVATKTAVQVLEWVLDNAPKETV